ncbi:MAG TPA: UDP-N-acetylmuramate--L-alanine ligase [Anaerolineaceae bacterium]|jgi:UDP-N-acetylmuramate--alanine ligase|nr:UDP-N-acetylmuramate--L-alanine ligase [Anaerolineaceae bacterium]HPS32939.1 UDP-N-acetylmuramate--L-alanine ligase [Anaerolineaceae bacterium]
MKRVHLIGIGGTGMSGIAVVLLEKGYQVSGSDLAASPYFQMVSKRGARVALGHDPRLALQADLIVRSSAVRDDDPEVAAARAAGIPVIKREAFLSELTWGKETIAVAGSHGKTTTTAMLICMLDALTYDPSFIVGAEIKELATNARWDIGRHFVIEADEYDRMFLGLTPALSVVTNIEYDHPDCFPTPQDYLDAFKDFINRTVPGGKSILCADDPGVRSLLKADLRTDIELLTYGFHEGCDYRIEDYVWDGRASHFSLRRSKSQRQAQVLGQFTLRLPGKHNVANAAAALAVVDALGASAAGSASALASFAGTERRFDIVLESAGEVLINDYGHHPTQVRATLGAARELYPTKKLWAVWEPHTFSRTESLQKEFAQALDLADKVMITKIYAAREPDDGFSPQPIVDALPAEKADYIPDFTELVEALSRQLTGNDVVVFLSAGKGPQICASLRESILRRSGEVDL